MDELQTILKYLSALEPGKACALATLVEVEGSNYRAVGARTLILAGNKTIGMISGGCLEGDIAARSQDVLADGQPRLVRYDSTAPEDALLGLGLGCNGVVKILIERVKSEDMTSGCSFMELVSRTRSKGEPSAVATVFNSTIREEVGACLVICKESSPNLASELQVFGQIREKLRKKIITDLRVLLENGFSRSTEYQVGGNPVNVLLEVINPPLALTVCGAGPDAQPLVTLAASLGWAPVVYDHRAAFARSDLFPDALQVISGEKEAFNQKVPPRVGEVVVLMTHSYPADLSYLSQLRTRHVRYIGVLGPRRRLDSLLAELGVQTSKLNMMYGPAGLDIGAESPSEIALAIAAEIQAVIKNRAGTSLRSRPTPIHSP